MTGLSWLVFGVILGAAISWLIFLVHINRKNELSCVICGRNHTDTSTLLECETCNKMVCSDNIEVIEEASTTATVVRNITPSDKNAAYPCGVMLFKENDFHVFCNKDAPRIKYKHKVIVDI